MLGGQLPSSRLMYSIQIRFSDARALETKSSFGFLRLKNNKKSKKR